MDFNIEYDEWFLLEGAQRNAAKANGYESDLWKFFRNIKLWCI